MKPARDKRDANGYELTKGDRVTCDGSYLGTVARFGGLGIVVKMELDGEEIDWANDQVKHVVS